MMIYTVHTAMLSLKDQISRTVQEFIYDAPSDPGAGGGGGGGGGWTMQV